MHCPFCGAPETQVKDSRSAESDTAIRRRRSCASCEMRFTTFERVHLRDMIVVKRNGSREVFDRNKLHSSIRLALNKCDISEDATAHMVNGLIREFEAQTDSEITSQSIGTAIMERLAKTNLVAYIRYASVYMDFRNVRDFNSFIEKLRQTGTVTPEHAVSDDDNNTV